MCHPDLAAATWKITLCKFSPLRHPAPPGARLRNAQCSHCSCSSCHCAANSWTAKVMVHQKLAPKALCGGTSLYMDSSFYLYSPSISIYTCIYIYITIYYYKLLCITITITIYYSISLYITIVL